MFAILWQKNADRGLGDQICLVDYANTDSIIKVSPGYTYTFRKQKEGKTERISMLRIQETAKMVFLVDVFTFDNTTAVGHKGIQIKLGEKSDRITLDKEFNAEQYGFSFNAGIYDLEGLNRIYFSVSSGMSGFGVSGAGIYKPILNLLTKTFKGKL